MTSDAVTQLDSLVSVIDQTYSDFSSEKTFFESARRIDGYLYAASYLARTSSDLSEAQTSSSAINDRLKKVVSYLSMAEDLMAQGSISSTTSTDALQVNALVNLKLGVPDVGPTSLTSALDFTVNANGIAKIRTKTSNPFTTRTGSSSAGAYELEQVSVRVGGIAARVLSVSPTELTVQVPNALPGGIADIVVSSREGFLLHGAARVAGVRPTIFRVADDSTGKGAVVDSLNLFSNAFSSGAPSWLGLSNRNRLSIMATGISSGVANTDTSNDVRLSTGQILQNLAESVTVEARTSDGRVFNLPVEFAGSQGEIRGVDQINVVLGSELAGVGDLQLTVVAGGVRSNSTRITVN